MRADQSRDYDAIQRECIVSHIDALKVQASIYSPLGSMRQVRLSLYEPTESKNVGNAKIAFDFDSISDLQIFLTRVGKVATAFERGSDSITTEEVEVDFK